MECGQCICCKCMNMKISEMDLFKMENTPLVDELVILRKEKYALEQKEKAIKDILKKRMNEHHIDSFETDSARISYVNDSNCMRVDSEKLKHEYPSVYYACSEHYYKDSYLIVKEKRR